MSKELYVAINAAQQIKHAQNEEIRSDAVEQLEHLRDVDAQSSYLQGKTDIFEIVAIIARACKCVYSIALFFAELKKSAVVLGTHLLYFFNKFLHFNNYLMQD